MSASTAGAAASGEDPVSAWALYKGWVVGLVIILLVLSVGFGFWFHYH